MRAMSKRKQACGASALYVEVCIKPQPAVPNIQPPPGPACLPTHRCNGERVAALGCQGGNLICAANGRHQQAHGVLHVRPAPQVHNRLHLDRLLNALHPGSCWCGGQMQAQVRSGMQREQVQRAPPQRAARAAVIPGACRSGRCELMSSRSCRHQTCGPHTAPHTQPPWPARTPPDGWHRCLQAGGESGASTVRYISLAGSQGRMESPVNLLAASQCTGGC